MEVFLKRNLLKSRVIIPTLSDAEIMQCTTDRLTVMHLCDDIIKRYQSPDPNSVEFYDALIAEFASIGKSELKYLIDMDSNEINLVKISTGFFTLMSMTVFNPKWVDWVTKHEDTLLAVFLSHVPDSELKNRFHTYVVVQNKDNDILQFATSEEIRKYADYLSVTTMYVKLHYSVITDKLAQMNDTISNSVKANGFVFYEYNLYLRQIIIHIIQLDVKKCWHIYANQLAKLKACFKSETVINNIEAVLFTKSYERRRATEIYKFPIKLPELPQMAEKYFPPCMTTMLQRFTLDGELKHDARKQLTLFLKDIGLEKDAIVQMYQRNYDRPHLKDKQNQVVYYVKHLLGLTGGFLNYKSYNCKQVQEYASLGYALCHGCYFKKESVRQITFDMSKLGFTPEMSQSVCDALKNDGYTAACEEHLKHRFNLNGLFNKIRKPNDYYNIARAGCSSTMVDIEDLAAADPDLVAALYAEDWSNDAFSDEVEQILKKSKLE